MIDGPGVSARASGVRPGPVSAGLRPGLRPAHGRACCNRGRAVRAFRSVLAAAIVLLGGIALAAPGTALAQKRVALVIGNDAYQSVPALGRAASDARVMGTTLESLGFAVIRAQDVTQRAMSQALARFDAAVAPGDTAFLFFAGHGFEIRGLNYLLPTDVPPAAEGQEEIVRDASFAVDRLVERLQGRGAGAIVLVLDACRDNPFERPGVRSVGSNPGLAPMTPPEGVFVIYSAGARQEALDQLTGDDRDPNSVFTRNFAPNLRVPGLTLVQVAKRTQAEVKRLAATVHHEQTPAYYDQVVGDIVLSGRAEAAPSQPLSSQPLSPQASPLQPPQRLARLPEEREPAPGSRRPAPPGSTQPGASVQPDAAIPPNAPVNAPLIDFTRSNVGWQASVSLPEPAVALFWRFGEDGPFHDTGLLDVVDPRTGRRLPAPSFQLDAGTPAGTVFVRYVDPAGVLVGPFAIGFEPRSALKREQRRILEMVAGGWLSFADFNGVLVYFTPLVSYRCTIRELRIGIDRPAPDRVVPLPPCDEANPFAVPATFQPYLKAPAGTRSASIQIVYSDGSVSPVKSFQR